jgi:hypothetical protein
MPLPEDVDEADFIGAYLGEPIDVVRCETVDLLGRLAGGDPGAGPGALVRVRLQALRRPGSAPASC